MGPTENQATKPVSSVSAVQAFPPVLHRRQLLKASCLLTGSATITAVIGSVMPRRLPKEQSSQPSRRPTPNPWDVPRLVASPPRTAFAPDEQVFAGFLAIVSPLANSVIDTNTKLRGWMDQGWWRSPTDPLNARIMEQVQTLGWFYANERPWNVYYLNGALRKRLELALEYYLDLQLPDGAWPHLEKGVSKLAPTAFAIAALTSTLISLEDSNALRHLQERTRQAIRSATRWFLDPERSHWDIPIRSSNLVLAGLSGTVLASEVLRDKYAGITARARLPVALRASQSPSGYFYEAGGPDTGYTFTVMLPDLAALYHRTRDSKVLDAVSAWVDFTTHLLLPGPDDESMFVYDAVHTRSTLTELPGPADDQHDLRAYARQFIPYIPAIAPLFPSAEAKDAVRTEWAADPSPPLPRPKGDTSPRLLVQPPAAPLGPTSKARSESMARLPAWRDSASTEWRVGGLGDEYLFVRRRSYYFAAMAGTRITSRVRSGPGALAFPGYGTFILSRGGTRELHWTSQSEAEDFSLLDLKLSIHSTATGKRITRGAAVASAEPLTAVFTARDHSWSQTVEFGDESLALHTVAPSAASEVMPLVLRRGDDYEFVPGAEGPSGLIVSRGHQTVALNWRGVTDAHLEPTNLSPFRDGSHGVLLLKLRHSGKLIMRVTPPKL